MWILLSLMAGLAGCSGSCSEPSAGVVAEQVVPAERASVKAGKAKAGKAKAGKAKGGKAKPPVEKVSVKVYFVDQAKLAAGEEPWLVGVDREVGAAAPERNAVWVLFKGPTEEEAQQGLVLPASGAEGFQDLTIEDGTARLQLRGGCSSEGAAVTVFDVLAATLKSFESVEHVQVLDPEGKTQNAEAKGDSRPECLEP